MEVIGELWLAPGGLDGLSFMSLLAQLELNWRHAGTKCRSNFFSLYSQEYFEDLEVLQLRFVTSHLRLEGGTSSRL